VNDKVNEVDEEEVEQEHIFYESIYEEKFRALKMFDEWVLRRPEIGFEQALNERNKDSFVDRHGGHRQAAKALCEFIDKGGFSKADLAQFLGIKE